jgi:Ricin-type beta-trefoil lectin domain-like
MVMGLPGSVNPVLGVVILAALTVTVAAWCLVKRLFARYCGPRCAAFRDRLDHLIWVARTTKGRLMRQRKIGCTVAMLLALSAVIVSLPGSAQARASAATAPVTTSPYAITPGVPWADSQGKLIQGHNGSVVKVGSTYYWIGDDLANGQRDGAACYSSTDLVHWARVDGQANAQGDILSVAGLNPPAGWPASVPAPQYLMGSTKVIKVSSNPPKFVMWAAVSIHSDKYPRPAPDFLVNVATSSSVCGDYTWTRSAPFYPFGKSPSGDIGLFQAGGNAYLLSDDQGVAQDQSNGCVPIGSKPGDLNTFCLPAQQAGLRIYQLSPASSQACAYVCLDHTVHTFANDIFEAPAMFVDGGRYYLLASHKTSWVPNDNMYTSTTDSSLASGWAGWQAINAPSSQGGDSFTCDSQTFFVLPVYGSDRTTYIYLGDRWDSSNFGSSGYVWLPVTFSNSVLTLKCGFYNWSIDPKTGDVTNLASQSQPLPLFTFTNVPSGMAMQVPSYSTADQAAVDQSPNDGRTDQQWTLINVPYKPSGQGYIPHYEILNLHSQDALEVRGSSTQLGASIDQAPVTGADNQLWEFIAAGSETGLVLENIGSRLVVDVQGASAAAGATLVQESGNGGASQQWALTEVPGYWAFTSKGNVDNEAGTPWFGSLATANVSDVTGFAVTPDGEGYWLIESGGKVTSFGDAASVAGVHGITLRASSCPVTGAATDPAGGFWAYTACGDVYAVAGARFYGSKAGSGISDITGLAAAPGGGGYWLVHSDGTVYHYGDATEGTSPGSAGLTGAVADPNM